MIHICCCLDRESVVAFRVLYHSIAEKNAQVTFHILTRDNLRSTIDNIIIYQVKEEFPNYSNQLLHVTQTSMYRLLIPKYIQGNRVLYLDTDMLVLSNLKELYDTDMGPYMIAARAYPDQNPLNRFLPEMHFGKPFNAGVLLLDTERLREVNFTQKCLEIYHKYNCNDEAILNIYFQQDYLELDRSYNVLQTYESINILDIRILHFNGYKKPWLKILNHKYHHLWEKYFDDSDGIDIING